MDALRTGDLHLLAKGALAGAAAGVVWAAARRKITLLTAAVAGGAAVYWARPAEKMVRHAYRHHEIGLRLLVVAVVAALVTVVLVRWRHPRLVRWLPVAAAASAAAAWTAVPETTVILVVAGAVGALALVSLVPFVRATELATAVMAAGIAVGVLVGFAPTDLRRAGAIASLGLLLWWPVGQLVRWAVEQLVGDDVPGVDAGVWLIIPHGLLAIAAARWVGVAPDATRLRLVVLGSLGAVVAAACRPEPRAREARLER
jgi:hypothetical protein